MAAILNSLILNFAILDSAILVFLSNSLTLAKIGSHHLHKKNFTHTSLPTICTKKTSLIHWFSPFAQNKTSLIHWFPPFAQKNFTHSFWLNLMMAAILNSAMLDSDTAILDSDTLLTSLRFTQKHSAPHSDSDSN